MSWNIKMNSEKTRAIYFSHEVRPPEPFLALNIPFVNSVKYLCVIFDKKIKWRLHIKMIEAKAFQTFIREYSLLKSEQLNASIKLTLLNALIRSVMTCAFPTWEFAAPSKQCSLYNWQISKEHSNSRYA
jgi:hypothetical protein